MITSHFHRLCAVVVLFLAPTIQAEDKVVPLPPRMVLEPYSTTPRATMARSLATSPQAPLVAVAGERQVLLYNTATLELLGVFPFPEGQPHVVRFSREGRLLLAGGGQPAASGKVVVWDVTTGERVFEVGNEPDVVLAADISADHKRIALGGPQKIVRVYSTETGAQQYEITKHADAVLAVEFSPDGKLLATADHSSGLHLWESETGNERPALTGHTAAVTGLSWRGDSKVLASASEDATVRLWDAETGTEIKNWNAKAALLSLEFTRDGRLATSGRDQITRLWDQEGKQLLETPPIGDVAVSVTFCDESLRAIAASAAGPVQVYKADDAAALGTLSINPPTLDERLAAAKERVKEKTSGSLPLVEAVRKAEAELAPAQAALAAAQQEAAAFQKNIDAIAAEVKQITESRAASDAERTKVATVIAQVQQAQPLVAEALRHLTEALGKAPDDKALTEAQAQLTEKLKAMETQVTELQAKNAELTEVVNAADAKLGEANARLETARKESAPAAERVVALEAQSQQLAAALETAKKAAQPAEAEVAAAEHEVDRWLDEIAFRDQMAALQNELDAARKLAAQRQAELDKANEQLATAQTVFNTTKSQLDEASKNVESTYAKIEAARKPK